jgi:hypothetical protein
MPRITDKGSGSHFPVPMPQVTGKMTGSPAPYQPVPMPDPFPRRPDDDVEGFEDFEDFYNYVIGLKPGLRKNLYKFPWLRQELTKYWNNLIGSALKKWRQHQQPDQGIGVPKTEGKLSGQSL